MELEIRPVFLVPDTNGFIDHLSSLITLLDCRKFILVVPLIGESGRCYGRGFPSPPARAVPPYRLPLSMPHVPAVPVWSGAGWLTLWGWPLSCSVSSQTRLAFLRPVSPFSLPTSFLPAVLSKLLSSWCVWGCQGLGEAGGC